MRARGLSKSRLLSSLQCPKRLWLEINRADLSEYSAAAEARFSVGHDVGEVARRLVPQGVLVAGDNDLSAALATTRELLQAGAPALFEATFEHNAVLVRTDVLTQRRGKVDINEVKATTEVKEHHLKDAAIQAWVVAGAGLKLGTIAIQHIDRGFVYPGDGQYQGLFSEVPVGRQIAPLMEAVPKWIDEARRTLDGTEPIIEMGSQCADPYPCPFTSYCSSQTPQIGLPLTLLPNAGRTIPRLVAEGCHDLSDIPEGRLQSEAQERVRRAHVSGRPGFEPAARKVMREFAYPRAFLDFETINFAVPIWKGVRPYQQIPFQWSLQLESRRARTEYFEFLDVSGSLPVEPLARELLQVIPDDGPVFAYGAQFERSCLDILADLVPARRRALERVQARLVDLHRVVRAHYYHPDMRGSWSLKAVVPTIPGGVRYEELGEVQDGGSAQVAYVEAIAPRTTSQRRSELERALLRYCKHDTEALLILSRFLQAGPA